MPNALKQTIWTLIVCLGFGGCASLLSDFEKATLVSAVDLGSLKTYTRTLSPPLGSASLIVAVPNHRCAPLNDAPISFTVRRNGATILSERKLLSQLTWSYGRDSCDAYGYLRTPAGSASSAEYGEMRLDIKAGQGPLTFEIDVSQIASTPQRGASVWLVYGDRVPTARIFGEKR